MSEKIQIKVIISGRVQGVFFRQETQRMAQGLGLKGYVKNLADGSVEAIFQGSQPDVKKAVEWCHQGPPASLVSQVLKSDPEPLSGFTDFEVRY